VAHPATSPLNFTPPRGETTGVENGRGLESPANRALSELSLALSGDEADAGAWSRGKTLRFIVLSCGVFWLAAATAYFTLH